MIFASLFTIKIFKKMIKSVFTLLLLTLSTFGLMAQTKEKSNNSNSKKMVTEVNNYVHFHGSPAKGKILMVASSPSVSKQTQWPIGFWAAELTHPLRVFQEAGYEVELVSTEGGKLQMDGYSNPTDASGYSAHDVISLGYMQQKSFNDMLANTKK